MGNPDDPRGPAHRARGRVHRHGGHDVHAQVAGLRPRHGGDDAPLPVQRHVLPDLGLSSLARDDRGVDTAVPRRAHVAQLLHRGGGPDGAGGHRVSRHPRAHRRDHHRTPLAGPAAEVAPHRPRRRSR